MECRGGGGGGTKEVWKTHERVKRGGSESSFGSVNPCFGTPHTASVSSNVGGHSAETGAVRRPIGAGLFPFANVVVDVVCATCIVCSECKHIQSNERENARTLSTEKSEMKQEKFDSTVLPIMADRHSENFLVKLQKLHCVNDMHAFTVIE